jgi:hypothetical protein
MQYCGAALFFYDSICDFLESEKIKNKSFFRLPLKTMMGTGSAT